MTNANPETFDLFAFSSGATEPEEIVTIYMDGKTAQQILDTEKRIAQASSDEVEALEDEMEKLKTEVDDYVDQLQLPEQDDEFNDYEEEYC